MGNAFFNEYPYTDFHEMNLTWVIQTILKMDTSLKEFIINNAIKYADPIQWNITRQYEENTIVIAKLRNSLSLYQACTCWCGYHKHRLLDSCLYTGSSCK